MSNNTMGQLDVPGSVMGVAAGGARSTSTSYQLNWVAGAGRFAPQGTARSTSYSLTAPPIVTRSR